MNNNNDDKKRKTLGIIRTVVILELAWILLYLLNSYPSSEAEDAALEETEVVEEQVDTAPVSEVSDEIVLRTPTPVLERIQLDENVTMIYVDDIAYLVYESGYGAAHSVTITPMYNEDGSILVREKE